MISISNRDVSVASTVVAMILNIILLPLIAFKSSKMMGSYKYLLFLYTLQSLIYSAFAFLLTPQFYVSEGNMVLYSVSDNFSSIFNGTCVLLFFVCCWIQIVVIINLCFLHRYWTLIESEHKWWFTKKSKILCIILADLMFTLLMATDVIWGCWPNSYKNMIVGEDFHRITGFNITEVPYLGGPEWIGGVMQYPLVSTSSLFGVYAFFSSILVGLIISRMVPIFWKLLAHAKTSKMVYQQRIFALLLFQTFFPVVFNFGPGVVAHFCGIARMNLGPGMGVFSSFLSLAQSIDPIVTFVLVNEYWTTVASWIKPKKVEPVSGIYTETGETALSANTTNRLTE